MFASLIAESEDVLQELQGAVSSSQSSPEDALEQTRARIAEIMAKFRSDLAELVQKEKEAEIARIKQGAGITS
jgi:hypothetical protein